MKRPVRLVVCINERLGAGQPSCVGRGNLDHIARMRQMITDAELDVTVVERVCLGRCEEGPVMRIAPGGKFFTDIDTESLPRVLAELESFVERER